MNEATFQKALQALVRIARNRRQLWWDYEQGNSKPTLLLSRLKLLNKDLLATQTLLNTLTWKGWQKEKVSGCTLLVDDEWHKIDGHIRTVTATMAREGIPVPDDSTRKRPADLILDSIKSIDRSAKRHAPDPKPRKIEPGLSLPIYRNPNQKPLVPPPSILGKKGVPPTMPLLRSNLPRPRPAAGPFTARDKRSRWAAEEPAGSTTSRIRAWDNQMAMNLKLKRKTRAGYVSTTAATREVPKDRGTRPVKGVSEAKLKKPVVPSYSIDNRNQHKMTKTEEELDHPNRGVRAEAARSIQEQPPSSSDRSSADRSSTDKSSSYNSSEPRYDVHASFPLSSPGPSEMAIEPDEIEDPTARSLAESIQKLRILCRAYATAADQPSHQAKILQQVQSIDVNSIDYESSQRKVLRMHEKRAKAMKMRGWARIRLLKGLKDRIAGQEEHSQEALDTLEKMYHSVEAGSQDVQWIRQLRLTLEMRDKYEDLAEREPAAVSHGSEEYWAV